MKNVETERAATKLVNLSLDQVPRFRFVLLVNQREKYHMGPLIRCGGRRSACARVSASPTTAAN
jgi:hypothetical protein